MGIVKISDPMHESLRVASAALSRSINAQAEHWMRIGMLAELHPDLDHREICQLLIRAEQAGGLDLSAFAGTAKSAPSTKTSPKNKAASPRQKSLQ
ncbi:ParD-like family protein [Paucibacter sp. Y2R2-4]|uniref:ParD-like family protein n=1 Tax=Paucibacter sp. Y2R2-4 TaxID=2893553 RepID=UPI0021E373DD|nr:ParD-like family protein [Paucibacter sp. Y2R2-4]MCV2351580.1 ParD-like family protein [Paucibacter sp. Y2R2-4]